MKKIVHDKGYGPARKEVYPPFEDFLDAVYWQQRGDPEPMTKWLDAIDAIKRRFPKDKPHASK